MPDFYSLCSYTLYSIQTSFCTLRPPLQPFALSSMIPLSIQAPASSFSHYQTSYVSGSDTVSPSGQQPDSRPFPLAHGRSSPPGATAPSVSGFRTLLQASTSSGDQNSVLQSSRTSPLYGVQPYAPGIVYMDFPTDHARQPMHGNLQPSDPGREEVACNYHMNTTNVDDQYLSGSPESGMYGDFGAGEVQAMWDAYESPEPHPEPLPDTTSTYTAPQLTSPANQRAANARRKREAKYTCDMCGSRLTAKHNLTSELFA